MYVASFMEICFIINCLEMFIKYFKFVVEICIFLEEHIILRVYMECEHEGAINMVNNK